MSLFHKIAALAATFLALIYKVYGAGKDSAKADAEKGRADANAKTVETLERMEKAGAQKPDTSDSLGAGRF